MFIVLLILGVIISILLNGLLLWGVSRLFKISNAAFGKSILVSLLAGIATALCNFIFALIGLGILGYLLALVIGFLVLYYFYKKYYSVSVRKSIGVYVVNIVIAVVIALVIVLPIRLLVTEPFVVSGDSMSPHLNKGDYIIIDKYDKSYERDDVIVYYVSEDETGDVHLIKRIVGLPTEKIEIKDGSLYINGTLLKDSYISTPILGKVDLTLQNNEYYVLGDNNAKSLDSRVSGPITRDQIIGKVAGK
jgi:signal peptidase I